MTRTGDVLLGIDLGTSSVKAVLAGTDGSPVASTTADYPVLAPHSRWAETDPMLWWAAVVDVVRRLGRQTDRAPVAIGLSGQMHGVVVCDAGGRPLRPAMLWSDSRAGAQLGRYRELPAAIRARLGNPLSPGMAGPLLAWLVTEEPQTMLRARWALQPKDWIRAQLTGEYAAEPSDASATLLYDLVGGGWDADVIAALGLRGELFPPLLTSSGAAAGRLGQAAADALGLPAGLPVAAGAADTAAAALGSGLAGTSRLQLTIGSGVQLVTEVPAPTLPGLLAAGDPVIHTYRAATTTGWYSMAAVLNGGLALDWVRRTLRADWSELYAAADADPWPVGPGGAGGPLFLPYLSGERTPHLDSSLTASWTSLRLGDDRRALLRAALEGVAGAIADARDALPDNASAATDVTIAGGGSLAQGWRQLLADALGVRLHALAVTAASAVGAAFTGALAAGVLDEQSLLARYRPPTALVAEPRPRFAGYYADRRRRAAAALAALRRP